MILGLGIDIIEQQRIKKINKLYKKKFIEKILNKKEITPFIQSKKKIEFLSKTFAIKESFVKALGTGFIKGLSFKKLNIKKTKLGKPIINATSKKLRILTALSHDKNITIAITILTTKLKFN